MDHSSRGATVLEPVDVPMEGRGQRSPDAFTIEAARERFLEDSLNGGDAANPHTPLLTLGSYIHESVSLIFPHDTEFETGAHC